MRLTTNHLKTGKDGGDFVRIDLMHGRTSLGRLLDNDAYTPFRFNDGFGMLHCNTLSGFWEYFKTGCIDSRLLTTKPKNLKLINSNHRRVERTDFRELILEGLEAKIRCNPEIGVLLANNKLPITRYTLFDNKPAELEPFWFIDYLNQRVSL